MAARSVSYPHYAWARESYVDTTVSFKLILIIFHSWPLRRAPGNSLHARRRRHLQLPLKVVLHLLRRCDHLVGHCRRTSALSLLSIVTRNEHKRRQLADVGASSFVFRAMATRLLRYSTGQQYKSLGTPQPNRAYIQRALLDENVQVRFRLALGEARSKDLVDADEAAVHSTLFSPCTGSSR